MQELAAGGTSPHSASTLRKVEASSSQIAGRGAAQGRVRPVEALELIGATSARTRIAELALGGGLTPLVGRRTEIEVFNKLVEQAGAGTGQLLAMVGEPGMGKSRLVHEFTRHQLRPGWLVLEGASVSYGKGNSLFPAH